MKVSHTFRKLLGHQADAQQHISHLYNVVQYLFVDHLKYQQLFSNRQKLIAMISTLAVIWN